jgi:hypothetical protein
MCVCFLFCPSFSVMRINGQECDGEQTYLEFSFRQSPKVRV